ncbi:MAG: hypothetical protein ACEQSR_04165 [Candidatus Methylacidiphilales bacterium]
MNYFLFGIFVFFIGCQNNQSNHFAVQIDKEVMQKHDEAMAKSSEVLKLKRQINQKLDSTFNQVIKDSLQAISVRLYTADKMMLDWMHQYQMPNYETDTAVTYLNLQLEKINKVHSITFESIKAAQDILKNEK